MRISLDNGFTYMAAAEAMEEIRNRNLWDAVVNMMDDDVREKIHREIAPCTEGEFLEAYLKEAKEDIVVG